MFNSYFIDESPLWTHFTLTSFKTKCSSYLFPHNMTQEPSSRLLGNITFLSGAPEGLWWLIGSQKQSCHYSSLLTNSAQPGASVTRWFIRQQHAEFWLAPSPCCQMLVWLGVWYVYSICAHKREINSLWHENTSGCYFILHQNLRLQQCNMRFPNENLKENEASSV